ncbi:MAG: hypothetical protein ACR652_23460 [Methylocystis sp.]|uniref:hypothetical protein n=1 Tax=Methylocystis sp. TaxID=1911079 RepID=UPI003DA45D76
MSDKANFGAIFQARKQGLLDELELVHEALAHAKATAETKPWLEKLEKWHNVWRDNLREKSATIRMILFGRGVGMIVAERQ